MMTCDGIDNGGDAFSIVTKRSNFGGEVEGWKDNFLPFILVIFVICLLRFAVGII